MSRKDFVAAAEAIKLAVSQINALPGHGESTLRSALFGVAQTARNLADVFADANPRFDRARFLADCGIN